MKKIIFITADPRASSKEEQAAWSFLSNRKEFHARRVSLPEIAEQPEALRNCDMVWWHFDHSPEIPDIAQADAVREALKSHIFGGGGLFLSLLAAPYVADLGMERNRPNLIVRGKWNEKSWAPDYPDMRGLATYRGHPIFDGFAGGPFLWAPQEGEEYAAAVYEDTMPEDGKVIAVEKCYIRINEQRRIALEYQFGRGRVVTVGTHMFFSGSDQRFRMHLESLTTQILAYVSRHQSRRSTRRTEHNEAGLTYWLFDRRSVSEGAGRHEPCNWCVGPLRPGRGIPVIHRDLNSPGGSEEPFDLAGRRALIIGRERGGISEVWCHPVRILKDLRIGFKVGNAELRWSDSLSPEIAMRPDSLTRRYATDDAVIEEVCFTDLNHPAGTLCYHIESGRPVELFITALVDLRLMWPLSEKASGGLHFEWASGLNAAIVTAARGELCSVFGVSRQPLDYRLAQSEHMVLSHDMIGIHPTERTQVAIGLRLLAATGSDDLQIVFSGSADGPSEAIASFRALAANPGRSLARNASHFRALGRDSVHIDTPDPQVNEAIQWAACDLDGLFATTPGLGSSLLAGYGSSSSGWDGAHAISGRPGYAWYFGRDSIWSGFALLGNGNHDKVRAILEFLGKHQDKTGKILHEMTTSGFAHYDAADATPLYLILMGRYVRSSGDRLFARHEFERVLRAMHYCRSTDTDGDRLIENTAVGHGWIEGGSLFPSHTEHYLASCWAEALTEVAFVANVVGKYALASSWRQEGNRVRKIVKRDFWNPETGFYRFAKLADGSFREEKTILPTVGMYFGCTDSTRSQISLAAYASDEFSTDWGVRTIGKSDRSFNASGYQSGSIWPLMTGWTSLAEYACDRPLQGFSHLLSNMALFNVFSGGRIEEVLHGEECKPIGVCPNQAWSAAMILLPVIDGLVGARVDAFSGIAHLRPNIPAHWNRFSLRNLLVGCDQLEFEMERTPAESIFKFKTSSKSALSVIFDPSFALGTRITGISINGRPYRHRKILGEARPRPSISFRLKNPATIRIRHTLGISFICAVPHLARGQRSSGLRLIEEKWVRKSYALTLEGKQGEEYLCDIHDPGFRVASVDGAVAIAREGERLTLSVLFPTRQPSDSYARKVVRLKT